jgi:hypothetical protein
VADALQIAPNPGKLSFFLDSYHLRREIKQTYFFMKKKNCNHILFVILSEATKSFPGGKM